MPAPEQTRACSARRGELNGSSTDDLHYVGATRRRSVNSWGGRTPAPMSRTRDAYSHAATHLPHTRSDRR